MIQIALLLTGASVALALAKWLRAPSLPLLLLIGVVMANAGLLSPEELQDPLTLGVTFLLFVGGMELSPTRVGAQGWSAVRISAAQFGILGLAGFGAALTLGFDRLTALYLALALAASSTLVVVQVLKSRQQLFEPFGRVVLGVLLIQDILVILLIPLIARAPQGVTAALIELFYTVVLTGFAFLVMRMAAPLILRLRDDEEMVLVVTLGTLFLFLGVATFLGVPLVSAAFLAGVSLSRFPVSGIIRGQLGGITDFFSAIFFTALGGLIILPDLRELAQAVVLSGLVIVLTPLIVTVVAERAGMAARPALESGLILSQTSELSLIVALQGVLYGQIGANVFTIVAIVTALTMLLTPVLSSDRVSRWLLQFHPLRRQTMLDSEPTDHVVLLGCGAAGMPLLETLLGVGQPVVVVDDDPAVITRLRDGDVPAIRGDALDASVLRDAGVERARVITSTVRRPRDNRLVLETVRNAPVLVRVFDDDDAEWVSAMGGNPILSSEAAAAAFLVWFDRSDRRVAAADPTPG
jgi:Kef-type K+ transport system membrane component KefB